MADAATGSTSLVADLSGVEYLDSAAVAALFARAAQTRVELIVNRLIAPVVDLSGLGGIATVRE